MVARCELTILNTGAIYRQYTVNKLDVQKVLHTLNQEEVLFDISETDTRVTMSRKTRKLVEKTMRLITKACDASVLKRTSKQRREINRDS